jgi:predicted flap endonuclease-1-like 5' DNA nuclease
MVWLTILDNETLLIAAQMLLIVTGSMLIGILLSYMHWGQARSKAQDLTLSLEEEKRRVEELRQQIILLTGTQDQLQSEIRDQQVKTERLSKTIYEHQQYIFNLEADHKKQKATIDELNSTVDAYQHRLRVIKDEVVKAQSKIISSKKSAPLPVRANFDHVSQLLGRQVTENDLTLITGIGPKTAALLHSKGIETWESLAGSSTDQLRAWLEEAGGIYKSHDPVHWSKQARMASQGEWRKLRVFQETLRNKE